MGSKASSSKSKPKSKPARNSAKTAPLPTSSAELKSIADSIAIGHQPSGNLSPRDESLFRAFQSNLLSLISHELRTPLMGIMNALNLLAEDSVSIPVPELTRMARQNAQRLHQTLETLLDLAGMESGSFRVRLREVELGRLVASRLDQSARFLRDQNIKIQFEDLSNTPVLGDPQKLGRAIDLCLFLLAPRLRPGSSLELRISSVRLSFAGEIKTEDNGDRNWDASWSHSVAGFQSGVLSPGSPFAGVMQSEEDFLTRSQEGLGSDFLLVHEILRRHHATLEAERKDSHVELRWNFRGMSADAVLHSVLASRSTDIAHGMGSVALVMIQVPADDSPARFCEKVKQNLFRASDAAYALPEAGLCALVLDDCKAEDAPGLVARLGKAMGRTFVAGICHCPTDGLDPVLLLDIAQQRLKQNRTQQ